MRDTVWHSVEGSIYVLTFSIDLAQVKWYFAFRSLGTGATGLIALHCNDPSLRWGSVQ
jgi:hypothetical protein